MPHRLTYRQKEFVRNYVACFGNASEAARQSGYAWSSAKQTGYALLKSPDIQAAVQAEMMLTENNPQAIGELVAESLKQLLESKNLNHVFHGLKLLGKIHGLW